MKAVEIMRELSRQNIPFSISYLTMNETEQRSNGFKREENILLMAGYRRGQSHKAGLLLSFMRMDTEERRQCYLPLLMSFNGRKIVP